MITQAPECQHKADPSNTAVCRKCGEAMPGASVDIASAFESGTPPVSAAQSASSTGMACIRCGADLVAGSVCCEACGLGVTWAGSTPHQELAVAPEPVATSAAFTSPPLPVSVGDAHPSSPTKLLPDLDALSPVVGTGFITVVVRCNRDIHDRASHPEYPAPTDPTAHTYNIRGARAVLGRPNGDDTHDNGPDRILAFDNAVSEEHAVFERLDDGTWEIRDYSRNGTRLNHVKLPRQEIAAPTGSGHPIATGDVVWCGYFTEIEIVALG